MDYAKQGENQNGDRRKRRKGNMAVTKTSSGFQLESKGIFLPEDVILDIFSRLPAESVLHFKRVCKTWAAALCSTNFINLHLKFHRKLLKLEGRDDDNKIVGRSEDEKENIGLLFSICITGEPNVRLYYGDYDDIIKNIRRYPYNHLTKTNVPPTNKPRERYDPIGSCNGLVCFALNNYCHRPYINTTVYNPSYILNLITREYINLPELEVSFHSMMCGFGYSPSSNEYKVVRIYYVEMGKFTRGQVEVYTIGSGIGWRNIGEVNFRIPTSYPLLYGTNVNGSLYWLYKYEPKILSFGLADEEFRTIDLPPSLFPADYSAFYNDGINYFCLQDLGRCLCIIHEVRGQYLHIWNMNQNDPRIWKKKHSINYKGFAKQSMPFALTKNGEVLIWNNFTNLCRYNPETITFTDIVYNHRVFKSFRAIRHMNSLVSLKSLGETNCKIRRRYRRTNNIVK